MKVRIKNTDLKILNSADLYAVMQKVLLRENKIDRNKEHFWVISLAQSNVLLNIELISLGTVTATLVEPMEVFSIALQKRSVKIILVHNHPGGTLEPSLEDIDLTDRLLQVGLFLDVPVLDHLIITEKGYLSFEDTGALKALAKSKRYVLPYKEQERLLKEREKRGLDKGVKLGLEKGKKLGARESVRQVALELKRKGVKAEVIAEATGLSVSVVKKLKG